MVNAISIASQWQSLLPEGEKPECTEGREGFFHVYKISGSVEECTLSMLVRDHDRAKFEKRKQYLQHMADFLNEKYGEGTVEVKPHDVYFNMLDIIRDGHMDIVELARRAMKKWGLRRWNFLSAAVLMVPSFPSKGCPAPIFSPAAPISTAVSNTCPYLRW